MRLPSVTTMASTSLPGQLCTMAACTWQKEVVSLRGYRLEVESRARRRDGDQVQGQGKYHNDGQCP